MPNLFARVQAFEVNAIVEALDRREWNMNATAQDLGINRTTLIEKIKKHGLRESSQYHLRRWKTARGLGRRYESL